MYIYRCTFHTYNPCTTYMYVYSVNAQTAQLNINGTYTLTAAYQVIMDTLQTPPHAPTHHYVNVIELHVHHWGQHDQVVGNAIDMNVKHRCLLPSGCDRCSCIPAIGCNKKLGVVDGWEDTLTHPHTPSNTTQASTYKSSDKLRYTCAIHLCMYH